MPLPKPPKEVTNKAMGMGKEVQILNNTLYEQLLKRNPPTIALTPVTQNAYVFLVVRINDDGSVKKCKLPVLAWITRNNINHELRNYLGDFAALVLDDEMRLVAQDQYNEPWNTTKVGIMTVDKADTMDVSEYVDQLKAKISERK